MKALVLILALILCSCAEENIEPPSAECIKISELYTEMEQQVNIYRATPGNDWAVLADMRKELKQLEDLKNKTCK